MHNKFSGAVWPRKRMTPRRIRLRNANACKASFRSVPLPHNARRAVSSSAPSPAKALFQTQITSLPSRRNPILPRVPLPHNARRAVSSSAPSPAKAFFQTQITSLPSRRNPILPRVPSLTTRAAPFPHPRHPRKSVLPDRRVNFPPSGIPFPATRHTPFAIARPCP